MRTGSHYRVVARRSGGGFTLIELMVVLVIISMLSVSIVPSVTSAMRGTRLSTTGNKLCDLLNFSYLSAVTRRQSVVVNLDTPRRLCWVSVNRARLPWLPEEGSVPATRMLASMELPVGTRIMVTRGEEFRPEFTASQVWETITFRGDGTADHVLVELTNERGERFAIEVMGTTGEVQVREMLL